MSYTKDSKIDSLTHAREREMLLAGRSYAEVAEATGARHRSISERNRLVYGINLRDAFESRVEREGLPNRLNTSDSFGYWFSGFFDGEGHLGVSTRRRDNGCTERRLLVQIMLRDDDMSVLHYIEENLGVGFIYATKGHGATNPKGTFRVERVKDLAEVMVPLFEKYPLHSKKSREFVIWKELVRTSYTSTLGGYSQRANTPQAHSDAFSEGLIAIRQIRTYAVFPDL